MKQIGNDAPPDIKDGAVRVTNAVNLHACTKVGRTQLLGARTIIGGESHYKRMKTSYREIFSVSAYRPECKRRHSCYAVLRTAPEMFVQIEGIVRVGDEVFAACPRETAKA